MAKVVLVLTNGDPGCAKVKEVWDSLLSRFDLEYDEVEISSERGKELAARYIITAVPTLIINGEVAFVGFSGEMEEV